MFQTRILASLSLKPAASHCPSGDHARLITSAFKLLFRRAGRLLPAYFQINTCPSLLPVAMRLLVAAGDQAIVVSIASVENVSCSFFCIVQSSSENAWSFVVVRAPIIVPLGIQLMALMRP